MKKLTFLVFLCSVVGISNEDFWQSSAVAQTQQWYSGDPHIHGHGCNSNRTPQELLELVDSAGLNVSCALVWGAGLADTVYFTGQDSPVSQPNKILHYDLEVSRYPSDRFGHLIALNLQDINFPPRLYTLPIAEWALAQDAVVGYAHAWFWWVSNYNEFPPTDRGAVPWEFPIDLALGKVNFLMTESFPSAPFQFLWTTLLNCGFKIPITAGSDFPCNDPVGTTRTYALVEPPLTYTKWVNAIKQGRTVIARGSNDFLSYTVNGAVIGSEVQLSAAEEVAVEITTDLSQARTVEIVVNGSVVATASVAAGAGQRIARSIPITRSSWIAVRAPRVQAGASYIIVAGKPIRVAHRDPQYYVDYINFLLAEIEAGTFSRKDIDPIAFEIEMQEAREKFLQARTVFQQRLLVAPTLTFPPNQSTEQQTTITLGWNEVEGTSSYQLQASKSLDFSNTIVDESGILTTSFEISGLTECTTYYWRVRAANAIGNGIWSDVWSFTTIVVEPNATTLVSPSNGETGVSIEPTLVWKTSLCTDSYQLQVSTNSDFSAVVVDQSSIPDTSFSLNGLLNDTIYYWRIKARNNVGISDWSNIWSFTTMVAAPAAPSLVSPADSETGAPTNPTLIWNVSTGATSYRLQVSTNVSFSTNVVDQSGIVDTAYAVSGLSNNTTYFWRVNAANRGGTSDWSSIWQFTTIVAAPTLPSLVSPADSETGTPTNPTLIWNASTGAKSYRLQVSTNVLFYANVVDQSGIVDTAYAVSGLSNNTTYFWRVNAANEGGTSDWSSIWQFTTIVAAPAPPTLASPPDSAIGISTYTTLVWNPSDRATSYQLQVSTSSNFSTTVVEQSGITTNSFHISGLLNNTKYFWRVNATNEGGTSEWSTVWSFTTISVTSVKQISSEIPSEFRLHQNYPNPFNPTTTIEFDLPKTGYVTLRLYNTLGEEVLTLVSKNLQLGKYSTYIDATNFSSGVYLYRLISGSFTQSKKMLLIR